MILRDNKNSPPLFSLGIAGNTAGHLQQTGENKAFSELDDINKPQALFPFYVPNAKEDYLASDPYSMDTLRLPIEPQAKVQMEPELSLKLAVSYDIQGKLAVLDVVAIGIVNDTTYRNANITKLAQKKNWGAASKGIARHEIKINHFTSGCQLDHFRLCGFHQHKGKWQLCGDDVALNGYSYFYEDLLQWLVKQIQQQQNKASLHNIQDLLTQANNPETILVSIGATRYSAYGEHHQLLPGDQTAVILYDSRTYHFAEVFNLIKETTDLHILCSNKMICLQQQVV